MATGRTYILAIECSKPTPTKAEIGGIITATLPATERAAKLIQTARQTSILHKIPRKNASVGLSCNFVSAISATLSDRAPDAITPASTTNTAIINAPRKLPTKTIAQFRNNPLREILWSARARMFVFLGNEIIIDREICRKQKEERDKIPPYPTEGPGEKSTVDEGGKEEGGDVPVTSTTEQRAKEIVYLKFKIPKGRIYDILRTMNLLQSKFNTLEIELTAKDGSISEQDYENKIMETFRQLDIDVEESNS